MATIVDDSNSNLLWSGSSWDTEHSDDPLTGRYFNSSFLDDKPWEGTDIYVYGARRKKYTKREYSLIMADDPSSPPKGLYGVVIDEGDIQYFSGYSQDGQFQATLFATNGLQEGKHALKISNENQRNQEQYPDYVWLDIDSVVVSGTLIDATSNSSSSSISSPSPTTSSSVGYSTESTDISSGQYIETVSSATIVSTSSETLQPSSQSRSSGSSVAPAPEDPSATAEDSEQPSDRKTITLAISIPVIVISSIVIFVFVGLYFYRKRKRRYERQYDHGYNRYVEEPQSSWR
ncbi:hypothetical protein I302_103611 [Kwoniella bestiolae CBS 10118]|uniref:Uncharacterized protein n=1 Tax=Kwoniella bestiolae CBS 10118 TaxID=1296100 RepID=A0A1B9G8X6_9TREE|nr:hypothetical protein I302_02314 [Kwoniella bestiolae CBS 10118]OCF27472.1 hypothetical protein I302_02314 [Kwoniella bestiolae CBS 10118]